MVILEALNAQKGDCLLLRYTGSDANEKLWLIDGGPKAHGGKAVWRDVLLPRLKQLSPGGPATVHLGMVSHIDDDHINGIQKITRKLVDAAPGDEKPVKFERFWFNSFFDLVGPAQHAATPQNAAPMAVGSAVEEDLKEDVALPPEALAVLQQGEAVVQSVGQGNDLSSDLKKLLLGDNQPVGGLISARKGQKKFNIFGAELTVIGPRADRLEKLREEWAKAVAEADAKKRKAAVQDLFLPKGKLDDSVPNLSSIVVLVEVSGKRLLLTGDALGDDVVSAWKELDLGDATVDVLKMPHHGSIRNCSEAFLGLFTATHYIFSADGQHDNPDGPTVEAVVKMHGKRDITLHFTNRKVTWKKPYETEKSKKSVATLDDLLAQLAIDYPGKWKTNVRKDGEFGVTITLAA